MAMGKSNKKSASKPQLLSWGNKGKRGVSFKKQKKKQITIEPNKEEKDDRLTDLPDDILINKIISLLPMVEAARTNILSRRWRYLFPHLDFDASHKVTRQSYHDKQCCKAGQAASDYIRWVGGVIDKYRGSSTLRSFRIRFHLDDCFIPEIDSWLQFCLCKLGTEALELDCCMYPTYRINHGFFYSLPPIPSPTVPPQPRQLQFPKLKLLKSLTLSGVRITDDYLSSLLQEGAFLETLQLRHIAPDLTRLDVPARPTPSRLKHINIHHTYLRRITISAAPDLVSLTHWCTRVNFVQVEHAPKLAVLSVNLPSNVPTDSPLHVDRGGLLAHPLLRYFSQLQSLDLDISCWHKVKEWLPRVPKLTNLKHLTVAVRGFKNSREHDELILHGMMSLINKARCLQRLTLLVGCLEDVINILWISDWYFKKLGHPLLREVEVVGFSGRPVEIGIVVPFCWAIRSLEKVTLRRRCLRYRFYVLHDLQFDKESQSYPKKFKEGIDSLKEGLDMDKLDVIVI